MKKKLVILLVAACVFVGAAIGVLIYSNTPKNVALGTVAGFVDEALDREEIRPVSNVLTKGSVAVEMDKCKADGEDLMEDIAFSGKIYFSKKAIMAENVSVKYDDYSILGTVYLSDKMMYLSEEKMFKESIGISYEDLAEQFKNSIFAYGSGSEYAIPDEEIYDQIVTLLETLEDKTIAKDGEKLLKKHSKKILNIIFDNVEISSKNEKIRIGGAKKAVRVVTIEIDGKAVAGILEDLCEYLMDDETIEEFLEEHADGVLPLLEEVYGMDVGDADSVAELYRNYLEELEENLDDLCDGLKENDAIDYEISLATPRLSKTLLQVTVKNGDDFEVTVDFGGKSIKKAEEITIEADGSKVSYTISKNNGSAYESKLKVDGDTILTLKVNKKKKTYSISMNEYSVDGSYTKKGLNGKQTILVEKLAIDYGYDDKIVYTTDLSITYDEKDKMPSIPKDYKTIEDLTDAKIKGWIEKFGANGETKVE